MNSIDEFATLVRDELGLAVTAEELGTSFDDLPGWDSLHLLWLLTVLERTTGRRVPLSDVLEAASLQGVYELAVAV
ncbi:MULTISPECIES: phosphopantetheine-binding protein [unclassified Streptomyces]|uniref:phosphopantetheine-binding protein n=1 Tax=unclassified Streptomyces TaxID=2593676 RepID=UPI002E2BC5BC|nr:phosphopantetheine-binding protein [Streptomyces sp. NBC_00223]